MKLCDYGCGRKAKFQLKNGKWCCNYNISSCPKINKKRKRSLKGKSRKSYAVLIRDSDLNPLCEYDCGNKAKYQFKNGKYSCSKSPNACPGIKIKQHTKEANEKIGKKFEGNKNPMFGKNLTWEKSVQSILNL